MRVPLFALVALAQIGELLSSTNAAEPVEMNWLASSPQRETISLNGDWRFKFLPTFAAGADASFYQTTFRVDSWKTLHVPSHWELHGFAEPGYFEAPAEGLGLYRRTFRGKADRQGKRVFLCFDGVLHGFTAWVNGKEIGGWASGFNGVTFDVTEALLPGDAENVIAVQVSTRSRGWAFDTMDCWCLSGIYRDVTLHVLPQAHVQDYTATTVLRADGSAEVTVQTQSSAAGSIHGTLTAPNGGEGKTFQIEVAADGKGTAKVVVEKPALWTAESPALYQLSLELKSGNETLHTLTDRIGLRQVTVTDGIFKLNGRPIKLRGVNHHDIWPEEGRVATLERMKHDLQLMREANINFIRTSHYPPHPLFIGLCDEMGFYVDCEVPFIHGREHLKDESYQADLLTRARATVQRDKNHPSILLWSVGNENPVNDLGLNAGRLVKKLDPSRPVTFPTVGSHFKDNWQKYPEFVDVYAPHYPGPEKVAEYAEKLQRPIIVTEYAHQRGIAREGDGVQDIWEEMYRSPRVAGGAVWHFQDQGILRSAKDRQSVKDGDLMVWLDEHRYYDTHGYFGVDGIVFSDRTPQPDYWQLRKVYSPVQITERTLPVKPGKQTLTLHIENRHDFRSLAGMKLTWTLRRNGNALQSGEQALIAASRETQALPIEITLPEDVADDVLTLELRCLDEKGVSFHERSLQLDAGHEGGARSSAMQKSLATSEPQLESTDEAFIVTHTGWRMKVDRRDGQVAIHSAKGEALLTAFGPHTARKLTINDLGKTRDGAASKWQGELLREVHDLQTMAERTKDGVVIKITGRYPRPGFPGQAVAGTSEFQVRPSGAIKVTYDYRTIAARDAMVETGLAFSVPAALTEFRWIGKGPFAGYKGRDRLNEFGAFHLNREDIRFPGNRRSTQLALLSSPAGAGLLMAGEDFTMSVEHRGESTLFSHVASSEGQTFTKQPKKDETFKEVTEEQLKAAQKKIAGKFVLLPLGVEWPEKLRRWLGAPESKVEVQRPFLSVYDQ